MRWGEVGEGQLIRLHTSENSWKPNENKRFAVLYVAWIFKANFADILWSVYAFNFPAFFQNYFEELVSVRDKQLARLQLELTSVGEEREKERAELEVVIIELQQQL